MVSVQILQESKIARAFSWISIQQKLVLAREIVAELPQAHAHERQNEGELSDFSDKKALAKSWKILTFLFDKYSAWEINRSNSLF